MKLGGDNKYLLVMEKDKLKDDNVSIEYETECPSKFSFKYIDSSRPYNVVSELEKVE
ncbi:MAG: hypothetical protein Fur003_3140 [Candidatus Dojkabacteria bacterium]